MIIFAMSKRSTMVKHLKNLAKNTDSERLGAVPIGTQLDNSKASFFNMNSLKEFFKSTDGFNSITMNGCYSLQVDAFINFYEHYTETGENLLNIYHLFIMYVMDNRSDDMMFINPEEIGLTDFSKIRKYVDSDLYHEVIHKIRAGIVNYNPWKEHNSEYNIKRREAQRIISNTKTRKRIFSRDNYKCKKCGGEVYEIEKQLRSADEPMTSICICLKCKAKWHN